MNRRDPVRTSHLPGGKPESVEGAAARDWQRVSSVYKVDDRLKQAYGGIQVLSVGEPFRSGLYPGWFVPYEVRMPGGRIKKHNLAVRNDNPQQRFILTYGSKQGREDF